MRSRPRLLFVGHSYHARTGSTRFVLELLEAHFEVQVVHDEGWQPGVPGLRLADLEAAAPDHVLFWQRLPGRRALRTLRCSSITWAPMHDDVRYAHRRHWQKLAGAGLKLLSFSRHVHEYFCDLGYDSRFLRYFPAPAARPAAFDSGLQIFFWLRREKLGWPTLRALLGDVRPARIVLRFAPDPGEHPERPTAEECRDYRIELVERWLPAGEYAALLQTCNVFVAPRLAEGIGMALLEAMAQGMTVVAADAPTMNEYIQDGDTGYLFDPESPRPLNLSDAAAIGARAHRAVVEGRRLWLTQSPALIEQVSKTGPLPAWSWRLRRALRL